MPREIFDRKVNESKHDTLPVWSVRIGHDGPDNVHAATEERAEKVFREYYGITHSKHDAEVSPSVPVEPEPEAKSEPVRPLNPKTGKPFFGPITPEERLILKRVADKAAADKVIADKAAAARKAAGQE